MRQFYVYMHIRPDGSPFYVGKGCDKRANQFSNRSHRHNCIVAKYGRENIGVLIFNCESEARAHELEKEYISVFRSSGFDLVNVCAGGEGATGAVRSPETRAKMAASKMGWQPSDATRKKMAQSAKERPPISEETRKLMADRMRGNTYLRGTKPTDETRAKMAAAQLGRKHSAETKQKISESNVGRHSGTKK